MSSTSLPEPAISSPATTTVKRLVIRDAAGAVFRFLQRLYLFMFCIFLHLLTVGVHVMLIVFDFKKHQFLAKETLTTDLIFLAVAMAPTAIVRTYIVIVLLVTQQLAMKRNYHVKQTLAALHEKSAAWMGLGSAFTGMWRQRRLRAARMDVFLILIYLFCLFILGISAPALIEVTFVSDSDDIFTRTTTYSSQVNSDDIQDAFPIVNILPLLDVEIFTIGYSAGTIFNVPTSIDQDASASAVQFHVDCGAVPGLVQSGNASAVERSGTTEVTVTYPFCVHADLEDIMISPAPQTFSILSPKPINPQNTINSPVFFVAASGIQIVNDTSNLDNGLRKSLSITSITPPVMPTECDPASDCVSISSVQIVACNVRAENTTIKVNLESAEPDISSIPDPAQWQDWMLPAPPSPSQKYLAPLGNFADLSPLSDNIRTFKITIGAQTMTSMRNSTLLEDNIKAYLSDWDELTPVTLGDLNFALEQAFAVVYWRATFQRAISGRRVPTDDGPGSFQVLVNRYTPWIGLSVSVVLLFTAIVLTRQPTSSPPELDSIGSPGVLQLAWIMGRVPDIAKRISGKVSDPTSDELLRAGKEIHVRMRDHIEAGRRDTSAVRKSASDSGKDTASDGEKEAGTSINEREAQNQAILDTMTALSPTGN